jgi:hypothetical protein
MASAEAPSITSLTPAEVIAGGADLMLTIDGANFTPDSIVLWNGSALETSYKSETELTATIPASLIASDGAVSITVHGDGLDSPGAVLMIDAQVVAINGQSAPPRPASVVMRPDPSGTIAEVAPASSAMVPAAQQNSASASSSSGSAPTAESSSSSGHSAGGNANPISDSLKTSFIDASAPNFSLSVSTPPSIIMLSPSSVYADGGDFILTVVGMNFDSTSTVIWGTTALATSYLSESQLMVTVPAALTITAGTVSIMVSSLSGSSTVATYTIVPPPPPTILSLSPSSTAAGGADLLLTVNGNNFTQSSTVSWGATQLPASYISGTQMMASVPAALTANAGTVKVTVGTVSGSSPGASFLIKPPLPTITSLTPNSVSSNNGAFTLTVNGSNYLPGTGVTVVKWNSTALTTTYVNPNQLTAAVPANLLLYGLPSITVMTSAGSSSGFPFAVNLPPPVITLMGMHQVPAGYSTFTMSVYGKNFTAGMTLDWGSTPLTGTLVGGSTFTFTVPTSLVVSPGVVSLTVTTPGGTSAPVTFTVTQPPPTITSISPSSVAAGSPSFTLTIYGTNFMKGMNTQWGSTWVGATVVSPTELTVLVPSSLIASAGTVSISVYVLGAISSYVPFTVNPAPPVIYSTSPGMLNAGGAGFMLTVGGAAFTSASTVMWGSTPLGTIYISPTQLKAAVPASLIEYSGSFSISVTSPYGTSSSVPYQINPAPPAISGLSPSMVAAGGASFTLNIFGAYFTASTSALWGPTSLATTYISSTQLTAVVPANLIASAGTGSITVISGFGTAPSATFIISRPPSITTTALPSGIANTDYSGTINVTGGAPGYVWTVTGLSSEFTYFNTSGSTLTITGSPAKAESISIQVSAQDTLGVTAGPVTLTIQIAAGPNGTNNASLHGNYTCLLQGSIDDDGTRWASILNFQADGQGNFSNGIFDTNSYDIGSASGVVSGSYNVGADQSGMASIHTILTNNAAGVQTTQWALALSGNAQPATEFRMIEADDLGTLPSGQQGTAQCYLATPGAFVPATVSGSSFVFGMDGEDNRGNMKTTVGLFSATGGTLSNGYLDTTLGGTATDMATSFTGQYTAPDPVWGRFTLALNGAGSPTGFTAYIIDASRMFILDNTSNDGEQAGNLRTQQTAAASTAVLNGPFVLYGRGAQFNSNSSIPTSFYANLFQGTGDGNGNLTIQQSYVNQAAIYSASGSTGGPLALIFDPIHLGRASFSTASGTTYLYFYDVNKAFKMSINSNGSVDSGRMEAQTQTSFSYSALVGNYLFGELPLLSVLPTAALGTNSLSSTGTIRAGLSTSARGIFAWDQPLSTTYAWDATSPGTGSFLISSGAHSTASCASISATRFACIPQTDPAPSVQIMQQ